MIGEQGISRRQFVAMAFVAALSPLIRRFPRVLAEDAGRTAWLAVIFTALPLALSLLLAHLLFRRMPEGSGLTDVFCAALGEGSGRVLTGVYTLWLLAYAAFCLRAGAERFISTVYYGASPAVFVIVMALISGLAALGRLKPLARSAMLFRPLLAAVFVLLFALAAKNMDLRLLLPVTAADLPNDLWAAAQLGNNLSGALYLAFFGGEVAGRFRVRDYAGWCGAMLLIVGLMTVGCLGLFGPALTAHFSFPFFMLVRDVTLLGSLERAEPVVIAIWVFSDFTLCALLLRAAVLNLRFVFAPRAAETRALRRGLTAGCTLAAAAAALTMAPGAAVFDLLSEKIVPWLTGAFTGGVMVLLVGVLAVRRRL